MHPPRHKNNIPKHDFQTPGISENIKAYFQQEC